MAQESSGIVRTPRSKRVARGFFRIAMIGAILGAAGAIAWDIGALIDHGRDLGIVVDSNYAEFPQSTSDEQISRSLVAKWGEPKPKPWDQYAGIAKPVGMPYAEDISDARSRIESNVSSDKQWMWTWLILGGVWAAFWLALSWIIRGFMADN